MLRLGVSCMKPFASTRFHTSDPTCDACLGAQKAAQMAADARKLMHKVLDDTIVVVKRPEKYVLSY